MHNFKVFSVNHNFLVLAASAMLLCSPARAAFHTIESCGTAEVVSGDSCKNLKVEFKFAGCAEKHAPALANRIYCEGSQVTAQFREGNSRFQAKFTRKDGSWGRSAWTLADGVRRLQQVGETAQAQATKPTAVPAAAPAATKKTTEKTSVSKAGEKTTAHAMAKKEEPKVEATVKSGKKPVRESSEKNPASQWN